MTATNNTASPPRSSPLGMGKVVALIAGGVLGALALAAGIGASYEAISTASDAFAYSPPGELVDIGGYRLHLDCRGQGAMTVVLDAGLGGASLDWALVQAELARNTRVCSYDRAGMGWSEPGPAPRSPSHIAEELHLLLKNGGIAGPYILVGHSLAGKNVRLFAQAYPSEVAGMVLVDARSEIVESAEDMQGFSMALQGQATLYSLARQFGIVRLLGAGLLGEPQVPSEAATAIVLGQTLPNAIAETTAEGLSRMVDDPMLVGTQLGSIPLVVIAAGESMRNLPNWPQAQRAMAQLSTNGTLVVADSSHHGVHLSAPDIVIDAVNDVIAAVGSQ